MDIRVERTISDEVHIANRPYRPEAFRSICPSPYNPKSSVIRQTFLLNVIWTITQKRPRLKLNHQKAGSPPLLLLPLSFPSHSAHPLTPWNTINIHLPSFLPYFLSPSLYPSDDDERDPAQEIIRSRNSNPTSTTSLTAIPGGTYSHVSYVRVYANCRLRRIWFGEGDSRQKVPWEFELYHYSV